MDMIMNYETLGSLFELSREAVVGVKDGQICFANPAADALFGLRAGGAAAPALPDELFDGSHERASAALTVNDHPAEISIRYADGLYLLCLHPADTVESEREMLAQLRSVYRFSSSLMTQHMALDAMLRRGVDNERAERYAPILYHELYRLQRLCSHISTAANIANDALPYSPCVIDLSKVVSDAVVGVQDFTGSLGVSVELRCASGDYLTEGDEDLLETMLLSLMSSCLAHCSSGNAIQVGLKRFGKRYVISIDDNGAGLSGHELSDALIGHVPFKLTEAGVDTGLTVFIARGIAERHGGSLLMESGEKGTSVRVTLPYKLPKEISVHSATRKYEARGANSILTELSEVLPSDMYRPKFFD